MPKVGDVHTARISLRSIFGSESKYDPDFVDGTQSGSSASSSSNEYRLRSRAVLIWQTTPTIKVLVMSRFSQADVTSEDIRLFDNLTREYVLKRLIPVYDKTAYAGKRSIKAQAFANTREIKTVDTNLILIPTSLPDRWRYKVPEEYFPPEDLRYINHILHELDLENSKEHMKQIESLEHPRRLPSSEYPNDKDDNRSSSTSSSVPEGRSAFAMDCYFEKDGFMNEWLDHGELKGNLLNEY